MYRYFFLAWNAADSSQVAAAALLARRLLTSSHRWDIVIEGRGLAAFHSGVHPGSSDAVALSGHDGAIFGKLFERPRRGGFETRPAPRVLAASDSLAAVTSHGGHVLETYWGRYVALLDDRATQTICVLRDPSGALPCFMATFASVRLFFADVDDCVALGLMRFSINWKHVAAVTLRTALHRRDTGLDEVSEVQPGECVELSAHSMRRYLKWNPAAMARDEPVEVAGAAATAVRETTMQCVRAWASCYSGIVHSLSGGLDSSIVLSCLAPPPRPRLACLTHFGEGAEEDERKYARLAARSAGTELVEEPLDAAAIDLAAVVGIRRSPKPASCIGSLQRAPAETRLAARLGSDAIFSGAGGDALFYQGRADLAVADHVRAHGLRRGVLNVAADAALITRGSVWPLLGGGLRDGLWNGQEPQVPADAPCVGLVNRDVARSLAGEPDTPLWLDSAQGIGPGKRWHILSLSTAPAFGDPLSRDDDPEHVHPLLSQPLIELCLRIPTYLLIAGGWDRALARRAFADTLPPEIVRRRAKGGIGRFGAAVLDANIAFVRELLLDGALVREGILDRSKLEQRLSGRRALDDYEHNEILHTYVGLEAWLESWRLPHGRA